MSSGQIDKVSLSVPQLLTIIGTIAVAVAGSVAWTTTENEKTRLELKADIQEVKNSIPPDWFRAMVEQNQADIRKLHDKIDKLNAKNE